MPLPTGMRPEPGEDRSGIALALYPSTEVDLGMELQRSSGASTFHTIATVENQGAAGPSVVVDPLPLDGGIRTYRARHSSGQWYAAGPWTPTVSAAPIPMGIRIPLDAEAFRRVNTLFTADGVLRSPVTRMDGSNAVHLMSGWEAGQVNGGKLSTASTGVWVDGAARSFSKSYANPPTVKLFSEAGLIYHQPVGTKWTAGFTSTEPTSAELTAVNVTTTGFVPRARLVQRAGGLTARTANFSTGNSLAVGQASSATPSNAPSYNDQYQAHYKVDMNLDSLGGTPQTVTAVVAVDANTTGAYVQVASRAYTATLYTTASTATWSNETQGFTLSGVGTTDKVRVRFKTLGVTPGTTDDVSVFVHAFDGVGDPSAGLTYFTQSSASYAAMCETTNDTVTWTAFVTGVST